MKQILLYVLLIVVTLATCSGVALLIITLWAYTAVPGT